MATVPTHTTRINLGAAPPGTMVRAINTGSTWQFISSAPGVALSAISHPIMTGQTFLTKDLVDSGSALRRVVSYLPLTYSTCWLAGGAVRRAEEDDRLEHLLDGDFDLFFPVKECADIAKKATIMVYPDAKEIPGPKGTTTIIAPTTIGELRVQLIHFPDALSESPEQTLSKFDFTVCQGAIVRHPSGYKHICTAEFAADVASRRLRIVSPRSAASLLKRTQKFIQLGYYMDEADILAAAQWLNDAPTGDNTDYG